MKRLICFFVGHKNIIFETKKIIGFLFGEICDSNHWKCSRCDKKSNWTITESYYGGDEFFTAITETDPKIRRYYK